MAGLKTIAALATAAIELARLVLRPPPFLGLARQGRHVSSRSYLHLTLKSLDNHGWAGRSL